VDAGAASAGLPEKIDSPSKGGRVRCNELSRRRSAHARLKSGTRTQSAFEAAAPARPPSLARQFLEFLAQNKKWWLLPMLMVFALFGALLMLGGTAAAPFIYTSFSVATWRGIGDGSR